MTHPAKLTPGQSKRVARACAAPARRLATTIEPLEHRRLFAIFALDPAFADGGVVRQALGSTSFGAQAGYVDALDDGKVLVGGQGRLARYNTDGTPDSTFGPGGTGISEQSNIDSIIAGVRQSDGKVILLQNSNGVSTLAAVRFTPAGLIDTAYGEAGLAAIDFTPEIGGFSQLYITDARLQSTGKLVIIGYTVEYDPSDPDGYTGKWQGVIVRLNTDGTPDTSFGGGDGVILNLLLDGELPESGNEPEYTRLTIDDQDRLFIAGERPNELFFARFTIDGAPDATFSGDGLVPFEFDEDGGSRPGGVAGIIVQPEDDKIVIGGEDGGAAAARFNFDGSFDATFGGNPKAGVAITPDGYYLGMDHFTRDSAGRYVGASRSFPTVYRFLPGGALDESIGPDGTAALAPMYQFGSYFDGATSVDVDAQGRILFGSFSGYLVCADFRPDLELPDNGTLVITGTDGDDTISFAAAGANLAVTRNGVVTNFPRADVAQIDVLTGTGDDAVTATTPLNGKIAVGTGSNTVSLGDGSFTLTAGAIEGQSDPGTLNIFTAGDGDTDIETGHSASARITFGNGKHYIRTSDGGNDVIVTGDGDNDINAYGGNDSITTGAGNDSIQADNGDDSVFSGAGDDTVTGGTGADTIDGGVGNDHCYAADGDDSLDPGGILTGGDGDDILVGAGGRDSLYGGAGRDRLVGLSGPDLLSGGGGKDRLSGFGGHDRLYGGAANDRLDGGNHQDRIFGGAGNDIVAAHDGSIDAIDGGDGANLLVESDEDDVLLKIETI